MDVVAWFQENAWLASWITLTLFASTEATIIYLLVKFLGGLFSGMKKEEMKVLQWRLRSLGKLTRAERRLLEEQGVIEHEPDSKEV